MTGDARLRPVMIREFVRSARKLYRGVRPKKKKSGTGPQENKPLRFPESKIAHGLLDDLKGVEIGASVHNAFGLDTLNLDYSAAKENAFGAMERDLCGEHESVDIVAQGDALPFRDEAWDFVISSHVIEHFYDPITAIKEWFRVIRPSGYVFMVVPHKDRTFDKDREVTSVAELVAREGHGPPSDVDPVGHHSVWRTEGFVEFCEHMQWPVVRVDDSDDKVGNGFIVVLQKPAT